MWHFVEMIFPKSLKGNYEEINAFSGNINKHLFVRAAANITAFLGD